MPLLGNPQVPPSRIGKGVRGLGERRPLLESLVRSKVIRINFIRYSLVYPLTLLSIFQKTFYFLFSHFIGKKTYKAIYLSPVC
jgi:hypothetical protein